MSGACELSESNWREARGARSDGEAKYACKTRDNARSVMEPSARTVSIGGASVGPTAHWAVPVARNNHVGRCMYGYVCARVCAVAVRGRGCVGEVSHTTRTNCPSAVAVKCRQRHAFTATLFTVLYIYIVYSIGLSIYIGTEPTRSRKSKHLRPLASFESTAGKRRALWAASLRFGFAFSLSLCLVYGRWRAVSVPLAVSDRDDGRGLVLAFANTTRATAPGQPAPPRF